LGKFPASKRGEENLMARETNIWIVCRIIKLCRLAKISTSDIEAVLRSDLHVLKKDGVLIEDPSDKSILELAWTENLKSGPFHDFSTERR
jgi:hypothetical protein